MRKEILFAILAGTLFGLVVAFGVWKANSTLKTDASSTSLSEDQSSPSPKPTFLDFGLTISKPNEGVVITSSPVKVEGLTKANSWVSVSSENNDYVVKSGEKGEFSVDVDLVGGINQIVATAFDEAGNSKDATISITYSTEFESNDSNEEAEE